MTIDTFKSKTEGMNRWEAYRLYETLLIEKLLNGYNSYEHLRHIQALPRPSISYSEWR